MYIKGKAGGKKQASLPFVGGGGRPSSPVVDGDGAVHGWSLMAVWGGCWWMVVALIAIRRWWLCALLAVHSRCWWMVVALMQACR